MESMCDTMRVVTGARGRANRRLESPPKGRDRTRERVRGLSPRPPASGSGARSGRSPGPSPGVLLASNRRRVPDRRYLQRRAHRPDTQEGFVPATETTLRKKDVTQNSTHATEGGSGGGSGLRERPSSPRGGRARGPVPRPPSSRVRRERAVGRAVVA